MAPNIAEYVQKLTVKLWPSHKDNMRQITLTGPDDSDLAFSVTRRSGL